ncbi:tetratricopeptide repeat protein [Dokdonella sp.]|uniref:serine/threonine-protein kinase n=1 Tax=Dokdonella sp. TaxID=2291710 RepID=UPI003C3880D0
MPVRPDDFKTGGALQGEVAESLLRLRHAQSAPLVGDLVGNYRILGELGRGGMAIVYRAARADGEYEQEVALKWMPASLADGESEALFRRERQALADLSHPHIAHLLDGGRTAEGRPWFVMELINGQPLDQYCSDRALPIAQRLVLFQQVCSAVAFAHARGVLHRDIKPSNVLVDEAQRTRLLDFGIAQWLGEHDNLAVRAFTPEFASPEQTRGDRLTVASDVFQLGRLLATLLRTNTTEESIAARTSTQTGPKLPKAMSANVPEDLVAIMAKACATDPAQRYATADALAGEVRAWLQNRPVGAMPRRASYVVRRFVKRHPVPVSLSLGALAILFLGSLYFTHRLKAERDTASYQAQVATSVLNFLRQDLLAAADPGAAPGHELSVREALDLASASADQRFGESPVEHGLIRTTLAGLYSQLGKFANAEYEARKAVVLAQTSNAPPESKGAAEFALIDALLAGGKLDDAQARISALANMDDEGFGSSAGEAAELRLHESRLANLRGQFEIALALAQSVQSSPLAQAKPEDPIALWASEEAATNLQMLGRHEEALPLLMHILEARIARLGPRHPSSILAMHEIGLLKRHQGHNDQALEWLMRALAENRSVLGSEHPATLSSANELATVLQELQRYDEAESLFAEVLRARLDIFGEDHQFTRNSMSNLGLLHSLTGRLDQAAILYERALAIETRLIGESHPDTIALMHNIAGLYRKQGRIKQALSMHRRAIANAVENIGAEAWQTALFRAGYALTLQAAKRFDEANKELVSAIHILEKTLGPQHPRTLRAARMLADSQLERKAPR